MEVPSRRRVECLRWVGIETELKLSTSTPTTFAPSPAWRRWDDSTLCERWDYGVRNKFIIPSTVLVTNVFIRRNHFTTYHQHRLVKFFATYAPTPRGGTFTSKACQAFTKSDPEALEAHPLNSWISYYRANKQEIDAKVDSYKKRQMQSTGESIDDSDIGSQGIGLLNGNSKRVADNSGDSTLGPKTKRIRTSRPGDDASTTPAGLSTSTSSSQSPQKELGLASSARKSDRVRPRRRNPAGSQVSLAIDLMSPSPAASPPAVDAISTPRKSNSVARHDDLPALKSMFSEVSPQRVEATYHAQGGVDNMSQVMDALSQARQEKIHTGLLERQRVAQSIPDPPKLISSPGLYVLRLTDPDLQC